MKFAAAIVFAILIGLGANGAGAASSPTMRAEFSNEDIMAHQSASTVSPEYLRLMAAGYKPLDLWTLRQYTPEISSDKGQMLAEFDRVYNLRQKPQITSGAELYARRFEWALRLTQNGYLSQANAEYTRALIDLATLQIDIYRFADEKKPATRAIVDLSENVNLYLLPRLAGVKPSERGRLKALIDGMRQRLGTPTAHADIRKLLSKGKDNIAVFIVGAITTLPPAVAIPAVLLAKTQLLDDAGSLGTHPIMRAAILLGTLGAAIVGDLVLIQTLSNRTNVHVRNYKKAVLPEHLSEMANSCSLVFQ